MATNNYSDTINWLFEQFPSYQLIGTPAYKPGLDNVKKLCQAFGNPQNNLKFIHIAGSNGKGSTASMLASFLTENKQVTGLFTSPHLVDFRERIRVDGVKIDEGDVIAFCNKIQGLSLDFEPSFFEITFCMALVHFQAKACDYCVIETGLGGRLDATNIIHPVLSVITGISLEHTNLLGNTLEEIAFEKAGIIKEKVPVIIGRKQEDIAKVFEAKAKKMHAPLHFAEIYPIDLDFELPLLGDYQKQNFKTAYLASRLLNEESQHLNLTIWKSALFNLSKNTGFQGRLQVVSEHPRIIYDVSHNAEGIELTLSYIQSQLGKGKLHLVFGSSSDKDLSAIFTFFPKNGTYYLTEFENARSAKADVLAAKASEFGLNFSNYTEAGKALIAAKSVAREEDTILVFGSFFLIHDFLK